MWLEVDIIIEVGDYIWVEGEEVCKLIDYEGKEGVFLYIGEIGEVDWVVDVFEIGMYNFLVIYFFVEGKSFVIECVFYIDGEFLFVEVVYL